MRKNLKKKPQKTAFLICSVRNATKEETAVADAYVQQLETKGYKVHWPPRDTDQKDSRGLRICNDNCEAMISSDEIHIIWNPASQGSLFDFGMAFVLRKLKKKKIVLANFKSLLPTPEKSFTNVVMDIHTIDNIVQKGGTND